MAKILLILIIALSGIGLLSFAILFFLSRVKIDTDMMEADIESLEDV